MHRICASQIGGYDQFSAHNIGRELEGMSKLLDANPNMSVHLAASPRQT